MRRHEDLSTPKRVGGRRLEVSLPDQEAFGRAAERIARFFGTTRYLVAQTIVVFAWIVFNVVAYRYRFDPYPFILLNLAFSTQAAYAAPLILLAQGRQEERDREQIEQDRETARRTQADTEYLARELSSIRIALADVATNDDLDRLAERVAALLSEGRDKRDKKAKRPDLQAPRLSDGSAEEEAGLGEPTAGDVGEANPA